MSIKKLLSLLLACAVISHENSLVYHCYKGKPDEDNMKGKQVLPDDPMGGGPAITLGEYEAGLEYNGVVGRHIMVSLDSYSYLGLKSIKLLTSYYDGNVFTDFTITEEASYVDTSTVSTTKSLSSAITSSLASKAGLTGVEIKDSYTISAVYSIESTTTYSYSEARSYSISYHVSPEVTNGNVFALCVAAKVYKISCQTWKYDNFWWGNYEVSGSRKSFYTYLTLSPYKTLVTMEGVLL